MLCHLCKQLLQDLSTGDVARRQPSGWDFEKYNYEDNNPSRAQRMGNIPCRYQHCKTLDDLWQSGHAGEMCKYFSSFADRDFFRDEVDTFYSDIVTMGLYDLDSVSGKRYESIGKFLFLIGEDWKPRPVEFQIYNPISNAASILHYSKDANGIARAHGSISALSLARKIVELSSDNDIEELMALARTWLHDCDQNHQQCHQAKDFIPTRVIDVGPPDGSQDPRLRITTEMDKNEPYLALSYCWGEQRDGDKNLNTTEETLEARVCSIQMDDLPSCYQDAVIVTRKLGFRFLWIDALCIIQEQESRADWMAESPKMAQIYGQSACTISAGSTNRCNMRFLQPRVSSDVGIQVEIKTCGRSELIGIREFPICLNTALSQTEIARRGWALQERMLSSRILHFTHSQMYWQCTVDEHSEDGRNNLQMPVGYREHRGYLLQDLDHIEAQQQWFSVVDRHKELKLSHPSDRLPSLAGIAKAYHRHFKSKYIFGLWESHLPQSLLWVCADVGSDPIDDFGNKQAPSWSWVNAPGRILHVSAPWYKMGTEVLAKVESANIEAKSEDSEFLGQGQNAEIGLCGKLKRLIYKKSPFGPGWLADLDQPEYEQEEQPREWQNNVCVDRERHKSRLCWGFVISYLDGSDDSAMFNILLLEELDQSRALFIRYGTASLSPKRYSILFDGASERVVKIV